MNYDLVVKHGRLITANGSFMADVGVNGERIAAIGTGLKGRREIDAGELYVLPGAIDGHVHLDNPTYVPPYPRTADSFATGSVAAAFGGVTTMIDFAQPCPGQPLMEELERRKSDAEGQSVIDYGLHLNYRDSDPARVEEIPTVFEAGVPSFKLYMAYEGYRLSNVEIFRVMKSVAAHNGLVILHAEDYDIVLERQRELIAAGRNGIRWHVSAYPSVSEGAAIHQSIALAQLANTKILIYHISCEEGVREVRLAKARGQRVWGEACPHHLIYTDEIYRQDNIVTQSLAVTPPIREEKHRTALWQGLSEGSLDLVGSDHCPRAYEEGRTRQPMGASGLETRLALMFTFGVNAGHLSLNQWVDQCCTRPAEIYGLSGKGHLLPGYDADLILFDPHREMTLTYEQLHSPLSFSSYEGITLTGYPITTISRGNVIVDRGELMANPGRGRFVERNYE